MLDDFSRFEFFIALYIPKFSRIQFFFFMAFFCWMYSISAYFCHSMNIFPLCWRDTNTNIVDYKNFLCFLESVFVCAIFIDLLLSSYSVLLWRRLKKVFIFPLFIPQAYCNVIQNCKILIATIARRSLHVPCNYKRNLASWYSEQEGYTNFYDGRKQPGFTCSYEIPKHYIDMYFIFGIHQSIFQLNFCFHLFTLQPW